MPSLSPIDRRRCVDDVHDRRGSRRLQRDDGSDDPSRRSDRDGRRAAVATAVAAVAISAVTAVTAIAGVSIIVVVAAVAAAAITTAIATNDNGNVGSLRRWLWVVSRKNIERPQTSKKNLES